MGTTTFTVVGERIKQRRLEKGLSQDDIAKVLGVTRPVVSKIESGKKAINAMEIKKIADRLEITVEELLAEEGGEEMVARFRSNGENDEEFLEAVNKIDYIFKEILGQMRLG